MILSIRRNRGCSGGFLDFRNSAAIPPARMVAIQPEMAINPATVRDIKTLESANETRDPASIHRYELSKELEDTYREDAMEESMEVGIHLLHYAQR